MSLESFFKRIKRKAKKTLNIGMLTKKQNQIIEEIIEKQHTISASYNLLEMEHKEAMETIIEELRITYQNDCSYSEKGKNLDKKNCEDAIANYAEEKLGNKKIYNFDVDNYKKSLLYAYLAEVTITFNPNIFDRNTMIGEQFEMWLTKTIGKTKCNEFSIPLMAIFLQYKKKVVSIKNLSLSLAYYISKEDDVKYLKKAIQISKEAKCLKLVSKIYVKIEVQPIILALNKAYKERKNGYECEQILSDIISRLTSSEKLDDIELEELNEPKEIEQSKAPEKNVTLETDEEIDIEKLEKFYKKDINKRFDYSYSYKNSIGKVNEGLKIKYKALIFKDVKNEILKISEKLKNSKSIDAVNHSYASNIFKILEHIMKN
ncbi:MAG: hypothetical protein FWC41_02710 [Firmicutes bacterium]|nr:hypothetical protein [Bacillota bacterium]